MKVLLIVAHPDTNSFNHALSSAARDTLTAMGHEVWYHDLHKEYFDPVLKSDELPSSAVLPPAVAQHCEQVSQADGIVIVHPNWWGQPPAILKGWIDRVLRSGVAYRFKEGDNGEGIPEGLLKATTAVVINTANTPPARERAVFGDPLEVLWKKCIFGLCGVRTVHRKTFSVVITSTQEQRTQWLAEITQLMKTCFPVPAAQPAIPDTSVADKVPVAAPQQEWERIHQMVQCAATLKGAIAEYISVMIHSWPADEEFWDTILIEIQQHHATLEAMAELVRVEPNAYTLNEPPNTPALQRTIDETNVAAGRIRSEQLNRKEAFGYARELMLPVAIKHTSEIVRTDAAAYRGMLNEVITQSILARSKVSKRLVVMEGSVWETTPAPQERAGQRAGIISPEPSRMQTYHQQTAEYLAVLARIKDTLDKHSVWAHLSKVEAFLRRDVKEHFDYEEDILFKDVITRRSDAVTRTQIDALIQQHRDITEGIQAFEQLIIGEVFPLSAEKRENLQQFIETFGALFADHLRQEEEFLAAVPA